MSLKSFTPTILAASVAALALVTSGCSANANGKNAMADKEFNFLGLVHTRPGSFAYTPPNQGMVKVDELWHNPNMSGDQVSFLWGAMVIQDY